MAQLPVRTWLLPLLVAFASARVAGSEPLAADVIPITFSRPIFVGAPPGDPRLFVVERAGRIVAFENGSTSEFLNITSQVSMAGEGGLLGLAFAPDFAATGSFYVLYTAPRAASNLRSVLSRFTAEGGSAPAESEEILFTIDQPLNNHNGGTIAFRPDRDGVLGRHFLYIGLGDGGGSGDPADRAQDRLDLLGKLLRIDVGVPPAPDSLPGGPGYGIPADNPFVGDASTADEIWALGLRNPYRWSFDRANGDQWIADVGQNDFEEVDFDPAQDPPVGGANYGWDVREGTSCFDPDPGEPTCADPGGLLSDPILVYPHAGENRSVTGGYVYRGVIPDIQGLYFFADYITGEIWSFDPANPGTPPVSRDAELGPASAPFQIASFGEDGFGELYIAHLSAGNVYRIRSTAPDADADGAPDAGDNCSQEPNGPWLRDGGGHVQRDTDLDGYGNVCDADYDGDGAAGGSDFNAFRSALGSVFGDPKHLEAADCDGDGVIGAVDFDCFRSFFEQAPGPSGLACAGTPPCP